LVKALSVNDGLYPLRQIRPILQSTGNDGSRTMDHQGAQVASASRASLLPPRTNGVTCWAGTNNTLWRIATPVRWMEASISSPICLNMKSYNKRGPDTFWLKDASLEDTENLPTPGVIAVKIVEDLEADLEQMKLIAEDLSEPIRND